MDAMAFSDELAKRFRSLAVTACCIRTEALFSTYAFYRVSCRIPRRRVYPSHQTLEQSALLTTLDRPLFWLAHQKAVLTSPVSAPAAQP